MADYTLILEDLLKKASTKSGEEFKYLCTEVNEKIGVFTRKVPEYSNFTVDFNSQQYLPSSNLTNCVVLETSADSLCFRSFSYFVSGNEDIHTELRVRCVVELAIFREFYMDNEGMLRKMFAKKKKHLQDNGSCIDFEDIANDRSLLEAIYQDEIISTCKASSNGGVLQLLALGSVVNRQIMSVYPETTPNVSIYFLWVAVHARLTTMLLLTSVRYVQSSATSASIDYVFVNSRKMP